MKIFKLCGKYLAFYKWYLLMYILLSFIMSAISIFTPYLTGNFIDSLVSGEGISSIYRFIYIFSGITVFRMVFGYISSMLYINMQSKMGFAFNKDVLFHVQDLSLSFIGKSNAAFLNQTTNNDTNTLIIFCISIIQNVIINIVTLIVTLYISFSINATISLLFIVFVIAYFMIYIFSKKILYKVNLDMKESQAKFFSGLQDQLNYIRFIKVNSFQSKFRQRLVSCFDRLLKSSLRNQQISYLFSSADGIVSLSAQILLFLVGGTQILRGNFTIGMFTVFTSYFNMMMGSARYFFNLGKTYQDNLVSYDRLRNILSIEPEKYGSVQIGNIDKISIDSLSFSYQDTPVINDVSLNLEKGNIYGIVGANGSGKSTLINLLSGLYVNEKQGDISYNGINIDDIDLHKFRRLSIGISEQEPTLLNDSVRYNLLYNENEVDNSRFNELIKLLNFDSFTEKHPEGLSFVINEKNNNLSGGEKQKISILRVLLKDPDVIIFDEPTSALDSKSTLSFLNYLKQIKNDKIIILISHYPEVNDFCDEVYYLRAGKLEFTTNYS